jgi:AcrR family transcriptional regulator
MAAKAPARAAAKPGTGRRGQRSPLDAVIAQLEDAMRQGTVDQEPGERVIAQLRRARLEEAPGANGGRREHILRVAARTFAVKGYRATSLQEIADEVGVTRPSFYYHFRSKQEILAAILETALVRAEEAVDAALDGPAPAAEKFRNFVFKYVEINTEHAEVPVLFQSFGELEPDASERARQRRRAIDNRLASFIEEGVRRGDFTAPSPLIAAYGILGAVNWMYTWYRPEGRFAATEVAAMLADLLLRGLMKHGDD